MTLLDKDLLNFRLLWVSSILKTIPGCWVSRHNVLNVCLVWFFLLLQNSTSKVHLLVWLELLWLCRLQLRIKEHFHLNKQHTLELIPENNLSLDELINYVIQTKEIQVSLRQINQNKWYIHPEWLNTENNLEQTCSTLWSLLMSQRNNSVLICSYRTSTTSEYILIWSLQKISLHQNWSLMQILAENIWEFFLSNFCYIATTLSDMFLHIWLVVNYHYLLYSLHNRIIPS